MEDVKGLSDEELVRLVCTKDQELYAELVRRYQDNLVRYAIHLVGDEAGAADVVQEAFIKAFVNLRGFNLKKKFSSWIYRIVHNEAINHLKKEARTVSLEENEWIKQTLKSPVEVEEILDKIELKRMLNSCLSKLPLIYRAPLSLFYLEEKSYEEISDILRLPVGTVGTRISRGKSLLAVICKKEGGQSYVRK